MKSTPLRELNAQDLSFALARLEYLENKRTEHIRRVCEYQKTENGRLRHRQAQQRYRDKLKLQRTMELKEITS